MHNISNVSRIVVASENTSDFTFINVKFQPSLAYRTTVNDSEERKRFGFGESNISIYLYNLSSLRGNRLHNITKSVTYLGETDLSGSLTEALSADVESVLTDDGVTVAANAAKSGE